MGIGNANRLALILFIQQSVLAFSRLDETQETKTPLMWVNRVDSMLEHFQGNHSNCSILERYEKMVTFVKIMVTFVKMMVYSRCDLEQTERPPIFKQLMANDEKKKAQKVGKMSEKLTDKLIAELRYLLVEKDNFAEKLCMLGTTSHCESNHARIVNRGFYTKGELF